MSWEDFAEGFASGFVPAYNARIEREARRAATKEDREYAAELREEERKAEKELFEWQITRENQMEQSAKDREYGAITDSLMTQYDLPDAVRPQVFASVRATGSAEGFIERYESGNINLSGSAPKTSVPRREMAGKVYSAFRTVGFSDNQSRALTAEVNRENSFDPDYIFGSHQDEANSASNFGMLSWQGSRRRRFREFLGDRGLLDADGSITESDAAIEAQAEFIRNEMETDPAYERTRREFLTNPDVDPATAHTVLGKNFIRWRHDDPKYRASGYDRIGEGYAILGDIPKLAEMNGGTQPEVDPMYSQMSDMFPATSDLSFGDQAEQDPSQGYRMSPEGLSEGMFTVPDVPVPEMETVTSEDTRSLEFGAGSSIDIDELAGLPVDELQRRRDLSTDPTEIALLDRAIDSAEEFSGDQDDWRDISAVREGNWRSIAAKADEAGDVDYAERVRALGEQFDEGGYSLSDQTYVITYQDDNGQTRRVTAPVDENTGRFIDLSTGNAIERDRLVGDAVPSENVSGFLKEYARISTRIEPFQEQRGALLDTMRSAEALENIVLENDDILTSIGGSGAKLINGLKQEYKALNALVTSGANEQEISAEIDRVASENSSVLSGISDQAQLATLFNAQVLRFAFNYAKTGLGQEGVGLSNKDFENALNIVSSGSSYDTFSQNLRDRVRESASSVEDRRLELSEDPAVRAVLTMPSAEQWTSDLLSRPTEEFVQSRGLSDVYQWSQGTPQDAELPQGDTTQAPEAQPDASGSLIEQYQNGRPITVTEELADRFPSLQGQVGKTIQRRGEQ